VHAPTEDNRGNTKDEFYEELGHVFNKFPKLHMGSLLGDFSAKVGRKNIFKPTIENESLYEIRNVNRVRVVVISKNLSWVQRSPITTFINTFGLLLTEKHRIRSITSGR